MSALGCCGCASSSELLHSRSSPIGLQEGGLQEGGGTVLNVDGPDTGACWSALADAPDIGRTTPWLTTNLARALRGLPWVGEAVVTVGVTLGIGGGKAGWWEKAGWEGVLGPPPRDAFALAGALFGATQTTSRLGSTAAAPSCISGHGCRPTRLCLELRQNLLTTQALTGLSRATCSCRFSSPTL